MTRSEFVDYLLKQGCLLTKKRSNGMWIMYSEVTNKLVAIPVTDPARAGNICRVCETLGVPIPDDPNVKLIKTQLDEVRRRSNFGNN